MSSTKNIQPLRGTVDKKETLIEHCIWKVELFNKADGALVKTEYKVKVSKRNAPGCLPIRPEKIGYTSSLQYVFCL